MKKSKGSLLWISLTVMLVVLLAGLLPTKAFADEATVPEGVYLDDIAIGGMTREQVEAAVDERIQKLGQVPLRVNVANKAIDIALADIGIYWSNRADVLEKAFSLKTKGSMISQYKMKKDLEHSNMTLSIETDVNRELLKVFLFDFVSRLESTAVNASVARENGTFVVKGGHAGITVDKDATYNDLSEAVLTASQTGIKEGAVIVNAVYKKVEPAVSASYFDGFGALLGEGVTQFNASMKDRSVNVSLATKKFNGVIIYPGESLSALSIMRPVTLDAGYKKAPTYAGGDVVDEIGGGICQVATTLYNAALNAELGIVYRKAHSRMPSYVPAGLDAMVYSQGNSDFVIQNNYSRPVYIETIVTTSGSIGEIRFRIFGVEEREAGRTISYESKLIKDACSFPAEGADPSEYFRLTYDDKMPTIEEAMQTGKEYAEQTGSFYPVVKADVYKVEYKNGQEVKRTRIYTTTYKNAGKGYISGVFKVNPDTYIRAIEFNFKMLEEGKQPIIHWASHKMDEEKNKPTTTEKPSTEAPTEESTEAPTKKPTEAPTEAPTEKPTPAPTEPPTEAPTEKPTPAPTEPPTQAPTNPPTQAPTQAPTDPPAPPTEELSSHDGLGDE
ncbi:MAG: VanW family protein [Lachnospiraceae bacterium]|nr:VanW family protein [Lachnospiraceae bacterium]